MLRTSLLTLFVFALNTAVYAQVAPCSYNTDGEIITNHNGFVACAADNGEQQLQIQYLGLCTETPTVSDYQEKCSTIFSMPEGKDIILSKGVSLDILNGSPVSLAEGTYTHAVVRIDSLIKMKGSYTFDKIMLGGAGGFGKTCWTATTGTVGTYSDLADYYGYSALNQIATQCGAQPSPEFTSQNYNVFQAGGFFGNSITGRSSPSGAFDMYTLHTPNTLSSTDPAALNGEHLLGIQAFHTPVEINANLKSVDFGFRLENMFRLETNWQTTIDPDDSSIKRSGDGVGFSLPVQCGKYNFGGNACLKFVIPMGFEFSVTTE